MAKTDIWQAQFTDPLTGMLDSILFAGSQNAINAKASAYRALGFCTAQPQISQVKLKTKEPK